MKLVVDIRHWLGESDAIPAEPAPFRRRVLRVLRIIEYAGPIPIGTAMETLIECSCKPNRRPCPGLLWVEKLPDETIFAHCPCCESDEIHVHGWQDTIWATGAMEPIPVSADPPAVAKHYLN